MTAHHPLDAHGEDDGDDRRKTLGDEGDGGSHAHEEELLQREVVGQAHDDEKHRQEDRGDAEAPPQPGQLPL